MVIYICTCEKQLHLQTSRFFCQMSQIIWKQLETSRNIDLIVVGRSIFIFNFKKIEILGVGVDPQIERALGYGD